MDYDRKALGEAISKRRIGNIYGRTFDIVIFYLLTENFDVKRCQLS